MPIATPTPQTACTGFAFDLAPEYETGYRPEGIAAGDLDGDGIVDIATANTNLGVEEYGVSILRGLGEGRFASRVNFFYPRDTVRPLNVYLEDLNGDGKLDIILPDGRRYKFVVLINMSSGPGNFDFSEPITFGNTEWGEFENMAFADFDGDGLKDILATRSSYKSYLFRRIGSPNELTYATPIELPGSGGDDPSIAVGDFDGDGRPDIARPLGILRNISTGPGDIGFEIFSLAISDALAAADLDGDGKLDLVGLTRSPIHAAFVLRNQSTPGALNFAPRQTFGVGKLRSSGRNDVSIADVDGDGRVDVLVTHPGANSVGVLRNMGTGPGSIDFAPRKHDFGTGYVPSRLFISDVDGDNKPDVLTANLEANTVSVLINGSSIGDVDLKTRRDYVTASGKGVSNVAPADFDGDGNLDIAVSYSDQSLVAFSVFANDGNGRFPIRIDVNSNLGNIQFRYLVAEDFDSDGRTDIALAITRSSNFEMYFFRNVSTGPGHFLFEQTRYIQLLGRPIRMYGADVNDDGKRDLIIVAKPFFGNERASVYRNDNVGSDFAFEEMASILLSENPANRLAVADYDLDGKDDFAYAISILSPASGLFHFVRFQMSTGTGFVNQDVEVDRTFGIPVALDADQDGLVDVLSRGEYGALNYKRNLSTPGDLSFDIPVSVPDSFFEPSHVSDFNGDGLVDILAISTPYLQIFGDGVDTSPIALFQERLHLVEVFSLRAALTLATLTMMGALT